MIKLMRKSRLQEQIKNLNTRNSRQRVELKNLMKVNEEHQKINGKLRQDNFDLDKENQMLFEQLFEANQRIDKAIEYLNTYAGYDNNFCLDYHEINPLIDILKGEE